MGDSYYASCYPSEVLDQRMEDASQDSCYPSRFPEYPRLSPQSVIDTDDSDATVMLQSTRLIVPSACAGLKTMKTVKSGGSTVMDPDTARVIGIILNVLVYRISGSVCIFQCYRSGNLTLIGKWYCTKCEAVLFPHNSDADQASNDEYEYAPDMEGEESSSDNSIAFSPWEGLEEEARTESLDSQSDSELDEDCEIDEDCEFDEEPEGTGAEELGKLVNGDVCDLMNVWGKMRSIDMNNDKAVASLIRNMTSERKRERLEFTAKDEADILAASGALPDKVNSDGPSELTFPSFYK
jgi:hypothetical protein